MKALTILLMAVALNGAELRIDHVTVAGRSLKTMEAQLASVGLKTEPGGPHTNHATEMSIASFPDGSYLELIAIQSNFDPAMLAQHPWKTFMEGDAGPNAWAVRPKNFAEETARLQAAGMKVEQGPGGRKRLDGVALEWETARMAEGSGSLILPFLIRDVTARDKRAYPGGKAANRDFTGVARVVIAVRKISDAAERFLKAYNVSPPLRQVDADFGAELAWVPDSPVIFAAPLTATSWIARRIAAFGEGPCAFVLGSRKKVKGEWKLEGRWFGRETKWFDPDKLGGWWLGVEQQ